MGILSTIKSIFSIKSQRQKKFESLVTGSASTINKLLTGTEQGMLVKKTQPLANEIFIKCIKRNDIMDAIQIGFIAMAHNIALLIWDFYGSNKSTEECIAITDAVLNIELYVKYQESEGDRFLQELFVSAIINRLLYTQMSSLFMRIKLGQLERAKSIAKMSLEAVDEENIKETLQKIINAVSQID